MATGNYHYQLVDRNVVVEHEHKNVGCWNSPSMRVVCMCTLGILVPILFIALPVYSRAILYVPTSVPLTASEMRSMNAHISTIWCQGQHLNMNTTFDAYLMDGEPPLIPKTQKVSITRHFQLDDDIKEYWGFYLLKGSQIQASMCSSELGSSVMFVRGLENLKFCAYVGSDSSEEMTDGTEVNGTHSESPNATYYEGWPVRMSWKRHNTRPKSHPKRSESFNQTVVKSESVDSEGPNFPPTSSDNRTLEESLTEDVLVNEDGAFEETDAEVASDGKAVDSTTGNQLEHSSESQSSTSSSEEAMRKCDGVIFSQPLVSSGTTCDSTQEPNQNKVEYVVDQSGYYYFVFSTGYEKAPTQVSVKFVLHKTVMDVSDALLTCSNATECTFPLTFGSNQRVIISLPYPEDDTQADIWDHSFVVESTCDPRTPLYLVFGLALPFIVLFWAFF